MNLKEIEGYALFPRFVENVLDVERMPVPRKYFSGEILSRLGTSGNNLKEIEGYALFSRFSKKCSRYRTHACTAEIFQR